MLERNVTFNAGWTVRTTGLQVHCLHLVSHFELLRGAPLKHIESEADGSLRLIISCMINFQAKKEEGTNNCRNKIELIELPGKKTQSCPLKC